MTAEFGGRAEAEVGRQQLKQLSVLRSVVPPPPRAQVRVSDAAGGNIDKNKNFGDS